MRLIVRKERPHPGAQLRFTDRDGLRLTAFVTNTTRGQLPDLELRHRQRARCEDRIRNAKDTGLRNLPFHSFDANRIWIALVAARTRPHSVDANPRFRGTMMHAAGNRKHYGCGCSQPPDASPATPAKPDYTWPDTLPGPNCSPPPPNTCNPTDQPKTVPTTKETNHPGPRKPGSQPAARAGCPARNRKTTIETPIPNPIRPTHQPRERSRLVNLFDSAVGQLLNDLNAFINSSPALGALVEIVGGILFWSFFLSLFVIATVYSYIVTFIKGLFA